MPYKSQSIHTTPINRRFVLRCKFYQLQWQTNNSFGYFHLEDLCCMAQSSPILGTIFVSTADTISAPMAK